MAASHGASFHSPIEVSCIIATGIDKAQEARVDLACILSKYGYAGELPNPDIVTKAKAHALIGLDMTKLRSVKQAFLKIIILGCTKKQKPVKRSTHEFTLARTFLF